jgi:hypothetical protein
VLEKIWLGDFPASRFCASAGIAAKQPSTTVTAAKMSARLNIPNLQIQAALDSTAHPHVVTFNGL